MQSLSHTLFTTNLPLDGTSHIPAAERIKKFRTPLCHEPGVIVRHPGTASDALPTGPFGAKSKASTESAASCMLVEPATDISKWQHERSEAIYASHKQEPLGRSLIRGHEVPEDLATTRGFGMTYNSQVQECNNSSESIIFTTVEQGQQEAGQDPRASDTYRASHGDTLTGPGEQRRRCYDWQAAGIDPARHSFGLTAKGSIRDGVKKCLAPALDEEQEQPPKVTSKVYSDFKVTQADVLGRHKLLGARPAHLPADHVFGKPSAPKGGEPSAGEVIRGSYSPEQQAPDADLGKSLREGFRAIAPENRVFGLPSIRTDAKRPVQRSVANTMNYGSEPNAKQLLRPPTTAELGVNEEHYLALRSREELQQLLARSGLEMGQQEFDQVFWAAAEACGQAQQCSLDAFLQIRHELLSRQLGL